MTRPISMSCDRRAFTFVELMTTLIIFALVATATASMMASSVHTQAYVLNNATAVSETELAFRRIVENIRSSSQCTIASASEIDLVTQPDTSKAGNPVYNISYMLTGDELEETDDRYGGLLGVRNRLVDNVTHFTATVVQSTKPTMFQITLTVSPPNSPAITRKAYVTSRNF